MKVAIVVAMRLIVLAKLRSSRDIGTERIDEMLRYVRIALEHIERFFTRPVSPEEELAAALQSYEKVIIRRTKGLTNDA